MGLDDAFVEFIDSDNRYIAEVPVVSVGEVVSWFKSGGRDSSAAQHFLERLVERNVGFYDLRPKGRHWSKLNNSKVRVGRNFSVKNARDAVVFADSCSDRVNPLPGLSGNQDSVDNSFVACLSGNPRSRFKYSACVSAGGSVVFDGELSFFASCGQTFVDKVDNSFVHCSSGLLSVNEARRSVIYFEGSEIRLLSNRYYASNDPNFHHRRPSLDGAVVVLKNDVSIVTQRFPEGYEWPSRLSKGVYVWDQLSEPIAGFPRSRQLSGEVPLAFLNSGFGAFPGSDVFCYRSPNGRVLLFGKPVGKGYDSDSASVLGDLIVEKGLAKDVAVFGNPMGNFSWTPKFVLNPETKQYVFDREESVVAEMFRLTGVRLQR